MHLTGAAVPTRPGRLPLGALGAGGLLDLPAAETFWFGINKYLRFPRGARAQPRPPLRASPCGGGAPGVIGWYPSPATPSAREAPAFSLSSAACCRGPVSLASSTLSLLEHRGHRRRSALVLELVFLVGAQSWPDVGVETWTQESVVLSNPEKRPLWDLVVGTQVKKAPDRSQ